MRASSGYEQLGATTKPTEVSAEHADNARANKGHLNIDATTNCMWRSHFAHGRKGAPAHPGYSKRPRQWVGTEPPTIELVREDLGLRLHTNFVGDIAEQSFIYKPSARLIDAFKAKVNV